MRLHLSCPSAADMSTNIAATPHHFWQKMKKDDSIIVFSVGAVDGMCSATLRAQAFRTPFFAPLTRLTRRGLKTAHRAVFLTSRSSHLLPCKKKDLHNECTSHFFGAVDGTCSATLRAQAFRAPFFAPLTRLLSRRGLKTAHRAVFLTSRSSHLLPCKKKDLHNECTSHFFGAVDGT